LGVELIRFVMTCRAGNPGSTSSLSALKWKRVQLYSKTSAKRWSRGWLPAQIGSFDNLHRLTKASLTASTWIYFKLIQFHSNLLSLLMC
jgi:hypothetical protein